MIEYGLITGNMTEKEIVQVLNAKLKTFFLEMADEQYNVYKEYALEKMAKNNGVSFNPKQIPWDYEYMYDFGHKYYGLTLQMYPNTNDKGEQKFKTPVLFGICLLMTVKCTQKRIRCSGKAILM